MKIDKIMDTVFESFMYFFIHCDKGSMTKLKKKATAKGVSTAPIAIPSLSKRSEANSLKT